MTTMEMTMTVGVEEKYAREIRRLVEESGMSAESVISIILGEVDLPKWRTIDSLPLNETGRAAWIYSPITSHVEIQKDPQDELNTEGV